MIADPQGATFIASQFVVENKDLGAAGATPPISSKAGRGLSTVHAKSSKEFS